MPEKTTIEQIRLLKEKSLNGVSVFDFADILKQEDSINGEILKEVIKIVSDQLGSWLAEYDFSYVAHPNEIAGREMEGWETLSKSLLVELKRIFPDEYSLFVEQQNLVTLKYLMEKGEGYRQATISRKIKAQVLSGFSIFINRLGFKKIATKLYGIALYPLGTMGRKKLKEDVASKLG